MFYGLRANFKPKRPGRERLQFLGKSWRSGSEGCRNLSWASQDGWKGLTRILSLPKSYQVFSLKTIPLRKYRSERGISLYFQTTLLPLTKQKDCVPYCFK